MADPGYRMKNPAHPGGFVKTEIIEPLGLSVTDAARVLGITRAALSTFLNERASLSPDMAIRIEKAFGVSMETLMRMQNSFDIAQAHSREGEIKVNRYVPKAKEGRPPSSRKRSRPPEQFLTNGVPASSWPTSRSPRSRAR
jgi:antitoxin HigA-1